MTDYWKNRNKYDKRRANKRRIEGYSTFHNKNIATEKRFKKGATYRP